MSIKQRKKRKPSRFYEINQFIKAEKLRVVDKDAKQLGVMTKQKALEFAQESNLDLVIVANRANPPVAKIINFAKFKYQEKQKQALGIKRTKTQDIKEVRFTPFIAENDYNIRINRATEFLEDGDKVRLVVKFVGRQITRKEFGKTLMTKAVNDLREISTVDREPAFRGKLYIASLNPLKK